MEPPYPPDTFADLVGLNAHTIKRWVRNDVLEYDVDATGQVVIGQDELERVREEIVDIGGIDRKADRVELYVRLGGRRAQAEEAASFGPTQKYRSWTLEQDARATTVFKADPHDPFDGEGEDAIFYMARYREIIDTITSYLNGEPPGSLESALLKDIRVILDPMGNHSRPGDDVITVIDRLGNIVDGKAPRLGVLLETDIIEPGEYTGPYRKQQPFTLKSRVVSRDVADSEAVAVPQKPAGTGADVLTYWLDTWREDLNELLREPSEGSRVRLAFAPSPSCRFEFRVVAEQ